MPDPTDSVAAVPVNIDYLIQTIKAEAMRQQPSQTGGAISSVSTTTRMQQPTPTMSDVAFQRIELNLSDARQQTQGALRWPERFSRFPFSWSQKLQSGILRAHRFLFKKQTVVNSDLIAALSEVAVVLRGQAQTMASTSNQLGMLSGQIEVLQQQLVDQASQQTQPAQDFELRYQEVTTSLSHVSAQLSQASSQSAEQLEWLNNLDKSYTQSQERLNHLESCQTQAEQDLRILNPLSEGFNHLSGVQAQLERQQLDLDRRSLREASYLREGLSQQRRLSNLLLEKISRVSVKEEQLKQTSELAHALADDRGLPNHNLDDFYAAFEDKFRGSREEITRRLQVYLPRLEAVKTKLENFTVLDLGTGRGEWLELLRANSYEATGVDNNQVMVEHCRAHELQVVEGDAVSYLVSLPDQSVGAITGFHIIEHLPFSVLMTLLQESIRVLRPGGLIIFETPNPENILVGAFNFYHDPTHRNPLVSDAVRFMVEYVGFQETEILNLHPYPEEIRLGGSLLAERFSHYFYGPQDYALIAQRAPVVSAN